MIYTYNIQIHFNVWKSSFMFSELIITIVFDRATVFEKNIN